MKTKWLLIGALVVVVALTVWYFTYTNQRIESEYSNYKAKTEQARIDLNNKFDAARGAILKLEMELYQTVEERKEIEAAYLKAIKRPKPVAQVIDSNREELLETMQLFSLALDDCTTFRLSLKKEIVGYEGLTLALRDQVATASEGWKMETDLRLHCESSLHVALNGLAKQKRKNKILTVVVAVLSAVVVVQVIGG